MRVALFEPEIAGNVGAILRLGACLGAAVDLIEPMGFEWDDRRVRRTAMDYIDHVTIVRHAGFDTFRATIQSARLVLFTTKSNRSAYEFGFTADDVLLFGKESAGVPSSVADACHARVRLPMRPQVRSMNLAMSAALALGEALRQTGSCRGELVTRSGHARPLFVALTSDLRSAYPIGSAEQLQSWRIAPRTIFLASAREYANHGE